MIVTNGIGFSVLSMLLKAKYKTFARKRLKVIRLNNGHPILGCPYEGR
jgi:hypothetical protein